MIINGQACRCGCCAGKDKWLEKSHDDRVADFVLGAHEINKAGPKDTETALQLVLSAAILIQEQNVQINSLTRNLAGMMAKGF